MTDVAQRVGKIFDGWAQNGRAEGMERGHGPTAQRAFDLLFDGENSAQNGATGELPHGRYLDVGCGNGYTVRWAAAREPATHATGIDVSAEMVARARAQSGELPNADYICDSFPSVKLPNGTFDAIFSMEVFYYFDDLHSGLKAVHDLLRPGGRFACVVDFYGENTASHDWPSLMDLQLHLLSEAEWRDAFVNAGIEVVNQCRLRHELAPGEEATWKHSEGSLLTLGARRA